MSTQTSERRRQVLEALTALQNREHRSYTTIVETHRDGTYYSARIEAKNGNGRKSNTAQAVRKTAKAH